MNRPPLTDRQQTILDYIVETVQTQGYPPTLRELSAHFGISSTQGIRRHLDALEKKGYLSRESGARSLQLAPDLLESDLSGRVSMVPLLGEVAAGQPIFADEHVEEQVPVCSDWLGVSPEHFLLRVRGQSMADAILPGDLVLVERRTTANRGEIVVALVEEEATVKRFFPEPGRVVLRSDNPEFEDIVVTGDLRLLGRVTALIRKYR